MIIARVIGEVVCSQKFRTYDRCKILQVQPLDLEGNDKGAPMSAIDLVDAGFGERVLVCLEGQSAVDAIGLEGNPVDAVILAVIDEIKLVKEK